MSGWASKKFGEKWWLFIWNKIPVAKQDDVLKATEKAASVFRKEASKNEPQASKVHSPSLSNSEQELNNEELNAKQRRVAGGGRSR